MPTYEYKCAACGHQFEKFQSMSADPIKKCPECGKNKVQRLIGTGAGLIFKGSGFYITDYRDAGYKEKAKAESGAASGSSDGKADGKPDAKADSKPADSSAATASGSSPSAESKPAAKGESTAAPKAETKSPTKSGGGKGDKKKG